jgi:hypothetical protein
MVIGLPIGSHITIAAKDAEGKDVMRPYTPVTDDSSKGHVDFVIKAGNCCLDYHCALIGSAESVSALSWHSEGASPFPW